VKYLIACGAGTGWNICYAHANEVCPTGYMTLSEGAGFNRKAEAPANDDRKSAIVTVRRPGRFGDVPDMTPEEHRRRGDAADALFREIVRRAKPWPNFRSGTGAATATTRCTPALGEPFAAFPSWFLRITCDRCGKDRMVNESHASWRGRAVRDILKRMHHDGCGGLPGRVELLTGIEGASSGPGRRIVLVGG
jgi:hypothetical protein